MPILYGCIQLGSHCYIKQASKSIHPDHTGVIIAVFLFIILLTVKNPGLSVDIKVHLYILIASHKQMQNFQREQDYLKLYFTFIIMQSWHYLLEPTAQLLVLFCLVKASVLHCRRSVR